MKPQSWRGPVLAVGVALGIAGCQGDETTAPGGMTPQASRGAWGTPAGQQQPKAGLEINYMKFTIDHHAGAALLARASARRAPSHPLHSARQCGCGV